MQRLMIFIDETDRYQGVNLSTAILEKLRTEGISGATVMRGTAGFGVHGQVHTAALLDLAISLPEMITAIDSEEKVQAVLPKLEEMIREGLIAVDEVQTITISKGAKTLEEREPLKKSQATTMAGEMQSEAEEATVSQYMDKEPITVGVQQTVGDVITLMVKNNRSLLPVINEQGLLLGVVQSEDLLATLLNLPRGGFHLFGLGGGDRQAISKDIKCQTASEVMRTSPPVVQEDTSILKASKLMLSQKIKSIPVVKGQKLVGILRLPDVLKIALEIECK
jgi:PII-like signaling protein/CBS domain-containing protein